MYRALFCPILCMQKINMDFIQTENFISDLHKLIIGTENIRVTYIHVLQANALYNINIGYDSRSYNSYLERFTASGNPLELKQLWKD